MRRVIAIFFCTILLVSSAGGAVAEQSGLAAISGYYQGLLLNEEDGSYLLEIEEYRGTVYTTRLADTAVLRIDTIPAQIDDFKPGMEVYARFIADELTYLEGYSTAVSGYIEPGTRVRKGTISAIDNNQIFILLNTGEQAEYYLTPITLMSRKGRIVGQDALYIGDRVKLYFDTVDSDMISRMEIEGDSILVNNIFRGELSQYDPVRSSIVLSGLSVFRNGNWKSENQIMQMPFSNNMAILYQGYELPFYQLNYYRGSTVYSLICNSLGADRIEKMILKSGGEVLVSGKIKDINWYTQSFELSNNMNFAFDDNTLIIRSSRLQNTDALESGLDVSVIASSFGLGKTANLVQVLNEDINNSSLGQHYIFAGRLQQVHQDSIYLKDPYVVDENAWDDCGSEEDFYYDNDIYIYDTVQKSMITVQELLAGDYSVDESSDRVKDAGLKDYDAYLYTDGSRVLAMALLPEIDSIQKQRVSSGNISNIA